MTIMYVALHVPRCTDWLSDLLTNKRPLVIAVRAVVIEVTCNCGERVFPSVVSIDTFDLLVCAARLQ